MAIALPISPSSKTPPQGWMVPLLLGAFIFISLMGGTVMTASAAKAVIGFGPDGSPTRVGNDAEYLFKDTNFDTTSPPPDDQNYQPRFIADSSLANTEWWTSGSNTTPWNNLRDETENGNHPAVQFRDPLGTNLGDTQSFWFGWSFERGASLSKTDFREVSENLPVGTKIYAGFSLFGIPVFGLDPSYVNGETNSQFVGMNAPSSTGFDAGALDAEQVIAAYRWFEFDVDGPGSQTVARVDLHGGDNGDLAASEFLWYVVLPDTILDDDNNPVPYTLPSGDQAGEGLTFTWTIDTNPGDTFDEPFGPINPNFGNVLVEVVPEPSRAVLLALAFLSLLMRRSRRSF